MEQLIKQIHNDFFTEVEKLTEFSKNYELSEATRQIIDKAEKLKSIGFVNACDVKLAEQKAPEISKEKQVIEEKKRIYEAIQYFSFKYPQYKFITSKSVKAICQKYGLIYGPVERYLGNIPDENVQEIFDFKIEETDELAVFRESEYIEMEGYNIINEGHCHFDPNYVNQQRTFMPGKITMIEKCSLEIVAPAKDFNTKGMEIKHYELKEVPDPIVLKPVIHNVNKYYLIVTAWGLEAKDVVNEKMN